MFRKVLVPLDGSDLSARVLDFLAPVLQLESATVVTLRVDRKHEPARGVSDEDSGSEKLQLLDPVAKIQALRRQGDPAEEILAAAKAEAVSLIAMSTHGRTGMSRLVRGSVAERVLRLSEVPLLLANPFVEARPTGSPIRRILIPMDGSSASTSVVPMVAQLAQAYESHVTFFHVAKPESSESPLGKEREAEKEQEFRQQVEPYVAQLEAGGTPTSIRVVFEFGAAAEILTAVEREAIDLVALATHGRSGLSRWAFGSVAEHLIRQSRAPLLVKRVSEGAC